MTPSELKELIEAIAKKHMQFDTLESRNSDSLDFKDVAVWSVKTALIEAFRAGQNDALTLPT